MRLTENELKHVLNVDWGLRFWRWFRWVLLLVLAFTLVGGELGWTGKASTPWLVAGTAYMLVAWPGMCRAYVYHALRRVIDADPEAREQLAEAQARRDG